MDWFALGDSAWLCEPGGSDAYHKLRRVLGMRAMLETSRIHEVTDIVSSFEAIAVHFDPAHGSTVREWLNDLPAEIPETTTDSARIIEIPVDYADEYSELAAVAEALGMDPEEVVSLHSGREYQVAAIGFSPGFPYLLGIDPRLMLPRKPSPRPVPAGAVAIAGTQAGIYPCASHGGWHVLGRTDALLFDPSRNEPAILEPGDRIRFVASDHVGKFPPFEMISPRNEGVEVIDPGMFSTIQDLGRPGQRASGVTPGGTCDPVSARVVNRLVGNAYHAAVIECTGSGPVLRFDRPTVAAWLGWSEGSGKPHAFRAGDVLDLRSRMSFSRGLLALSGGIDVPLFLDSRSTDVRAGLGGMSGRALQAKDRLPLGTAATEPPAAGPWHVGWPNTSANLEIRFLRGMQASWFTRESRQMFSNNIYQTTSSGDRTGMRLAGPELQLESPRELVSQPVVCGSIQVPPDGTPIVLLAECQTIGGYPQIGHVISADLPALARALPGTSIRFVEVGLDEAREAWHQLRRELSLLHTGLTLLP